MTKYGYEPAARIGVLIAEGRRLAGLTQQQLADLAAVSVGAVRDLEQGRTAKPRRDAAQTLTRVLGLDPSQLAGTTSLPPGGKDASTSAQHGRIAPDDIRLGVLGPLMVWREGALTSLGAPRQRAVLGLLAVHPGSVVHRETIIDAIWGHRPPASAVAMVQAYASGLRRLLGHGLLASDGTSYQLTVTGAQLDALAFTGLADRASAARASGDPAAACEWYERALRLWRGEALSDIGTLRGHPAVTELAERRRSVVLDYAEAAAATGRAERTLPQLRALTCRDEFDERAHARLMLALAVCGQQAAALRVFDKLRQRLDDELGITPGADLRDAHLRVLRGQFSPRGPAIVAGR
ncbi:MAG: helix-turn-helix domain-containing protein [Streptosporangiaceae bacterium]|nr:helix-turn-helix domain-containing protein [Streptosporangiaceae bacterium]